MSSDNPKGYANPDLLWSPAQLKERMDDPNLRIIDTRPGERYTMGHIPGARHFDVYGVNSDDSDEAPLRNFFSMWAFLAGKPGRIVREHHRLLRRLRRQHERARVLDAGAFRPQRRPRARRRLQAHGSGRASRRRATQKFPKPLPSRWRTNRISSPLARM